MKKVTFEYIWEDMLHDFYVLEKQWTTEIWVWNDTFWDKYE